MKKPSLVQLINRYNYDNVKVSKSAANIVSSCQEVKKVLNPKG